MTGNLSLCLETRYSQKVGRCSQVKVFCGSCSVCLFARREEIDVLIILAPGDVEDGLHHLMYQLCSCSLYTNSHVPAQSLHRMAPASLSHWGTKTVIVASITSRPTVVSPITGEINLSPSPDLVIAGSIATSGQEEVILHGLAEPVVKVKNRGPTLCRTYHAALTTSSFQKTKTVEDGSQVVLRRHMESKLGHIRAW